MADTQTRPTAREVVELLRRLDTLDRSDPQAVEDYMTAKGDLIDRIEEAQR